MFICRCRSDVSLQLKSIQMFLNLGQVEEEIVSELYPPFDMSSERYLMYRDNNKFFSLVMVTILQ